MTLLGEVLLIVALTLANGIFAGSEIAMLSVRRTRLQELVENGHSGAATVLRLREEPERFLATIQIGITLIGTTAGAIGGARLTSFLGSFLTSFGVNAEAADEIALATVILFVSYLSLVLGELVPKSLALRSGERFALLAGRPLLLLSRLAAPLVWLLTASSNLVLRIFRDRTSFVEARLSREEIQQLLDEAATVRTVPARAAEIASRALDLPDIHVSAVMTPRSAMVTVEKGASWERARSILVESGHTRLPVTDGAPDSVIGFITMRDLFAASKEHGIAPILRPIHAIPRHALASNALDLLRREHALIALVVDEYGGVAGLVTLEDLLEELVGEIFEEHERPRPHVEREGDGSALVRGETPVHELNRTLGLELPLSPNWVTINGLVATLAGALPRTGERFEIGNGTHIEVVDANERRVLLARVTWRAESTSTDEASSKTTSPS